MAEDIKKCKGCGKYLEQPQEQFHVKLFSEKFWDGAETGYILEKETFCHDCAKDIKKTLERLVEGKQL